MDIDLSNLSARGQSNFLNLFLKTRSKKMYYFIIFLVLLAALSPAAYFGLINSNYTILINYAAIAIPVLFIIFGLIALIYRKQNIKHLTKFIDKYSDNGLFHYCFECNIEVPDDAKRCPNCLHNLKFKLRDGKIISIRNIMQRNMLHVLILVLILFALIPISIMFSNIQFLKGSVNFVSRQKALLDAEIAFNLGEVYYFEPVKYNKNTCFGKILGFKDKVPICAFTYNHSTLPFILIEYHTSTIISKSYCQAFNMAMDDMKKQRKDIKIKQHCEIFKQIHK